MTASIQNFAFEREIVKENSRFLIGKICQEPAIIKLTLPTASMSNLELYKSLSHQSFLKNDVYETASITFVSELDVEIKCPATSDDIASLSEHFHVARESYEEYCNSRLVRSWVTEFFERGLDECGDGNSIVYSDEKIVVIQHGDSELPSLRWSCILRDGTLQSIRDIPSVELIEDVKNSIYMLLKKHNISEDKVCLYFDYCGRSTHLCLNIVGISRSLTNIRCNGKFIYLDALIQNLKLSKDYYKGDIVMVKDKCG